MLVLVCPSPHPPPTLEAFIENNELELVKSIPAHPEFFNLMKAEKEALRDLQGTREIIIKPADNGSAVVIANIADYLAEGIGGLEFLSPSCRRPHYQAQLNH